MAGPATNCGLMGAGTDSAGGSSVSSVFQRRTWVSSLASRALARRGRRVGAGYGKFSPGRGG